MDAVVSLATVNGESLHTLPDDLYIPPDALEVLLETFEGPLDLLLYLIKRQNLDILNIPIADITEQYLTYIQVMSVLNLDMAAEYLVMAALLAEIKSRLLLPRPSEIATEEDDPRATLIRRLQEYEQIKIAAEQIDELPRMERDSFITHVHTANLSVKPILADVELKELLLAFQAVLKRAEQLAHHQIIKEPLSVRERMTSILEKLKNQECCAFVELFKLKEGKAGVVVSFLAILELSKERLIDIMQTEPLEPLFIRAKY